MGNLSPAPSLLVAPCGQADVVQVSEEMEVIKIFYPFWLLTEIVKGRLGSCWFVAAASVLAGVPSLWERVRSSP